MLCSGPYSISNHKNLILIPSLSFSFYKILLLYCRCSCTTLHHIIIRRSRKSRFLKTKESCTSNTNILSQYQISFCQLFTAVSTTHKISARMALYSPNLGHLHTRMYQLVVNSSRQRTVKSIIENLDLKRKRRTFVSVGTSPVLTTEISGG